MENPLSPESTKIDDNKVETAVKFLQNPKVWQTPYSKEIAFLKDKGLNKEEIQLAIERSRTKEDQISHDVQQHQGGGSLRESYLVSPGQSIVVHQHR